MAHTGPVPGRRWRTKVSTSGRGRHRRWPWSASQAPFPPGPQPASRMRRPYRARRRGDRPPGHGCCSTTSGRPRPRQCTRTPRSPSVRTLALRVAAPRAMGTGTRSTTVEWCTTSSRSTVTSVVDHACTPRRPPRTRLVPGVDRRPAELGHGHDRLAVDAGDEGVVAEDELGGGASRTDGWSRGPPASGPAASSAGGCRSTGGSRSLPRSRWGPRRRSSR